MLKEFKGECSHDDASLFKDLENMHAVTVLIEPGASNLQTVITVTETQEGVIDAAFFRDMSLLMVYSNQLKQLEGEEQVVQISADNNQDIEVDMSQELPRPLAIVIWSRIRALIG